MKVLDFVVKNWVVLILLGGVAGEIVCDIIKAFKNKKD